MARSRVINIQRVSLSIYVYVSESDTYDTHATPFRGKKKKKIRRRQVCARSAESTAKRDSTAKSVVGIRLSRTSDCMAVSSVSHIRENSGGGSSIVDQRFLVREIAAKSRSLPNGRRNVARRSFRSRALIRGEKSASLSLSRTIALTDGEKTIEGKSRRRNGERSGRKVRKKKERKGKKRRRK